jgi:hypothetical protein
MIKYENYSTGADLPSKGWQAISTFSQRICNIAEQKISPGFSKPDQQLTYLKTSTNNFEPNYE